MDAQQRAERAIEQIKESGLAAPDVIRFGSNKLNYFLTEELRPYAGKHALVVLGRHSAQSSGLIGTMEKILDAAHLRMSPFS